MSEIIVEQKQKAEAEYFFLDPTYRDFVPGKTRLKFTSFGLEEDKSCGSVGFMALMSTIIAPLVLCGALNAVINFEFWQEGIEIEALILSCEMQDVGRGNEDPYVTYTYDVLGRSYSDRTRGYGSATCADLPNNSSLAIEYLPSQPYVSRIVEPIISRGWLALLGESLVYACSGLTIVCGVVYWWLGVLSYLITAPRRTRLQKNGVLIDGEIVSVIGKERSFRFYIDINYQFKNSKGKVLYGKQTRHREDLKKTSLPQPGTPVYVLYANDRTYVIL